LPHGETGLWCHHKKKRLEADVTRHWVVAAVLLITAGMNSARAEDYPARTITMIIPFAVGGPADITGRIVANVLARHLGRSVVVENINGAGGTIGALRAARATPDGYTILFGHMSTNALAPAFYPNLGYDPLKDFEPIGLAAEYPELLVVRKDFPANNLGEFVTYAKSHANKLNVGHAGVGSISYIGCLLLDAAIGIKPALIPFTGTAPVLNAMLGGEIDYECDPVLGTLAQVREGTVRALAIAAKQRSPMLPDGRPLTNRDCPSLIALSCTLYSLPPARLNQLLRSLRQPWIKALMKNRSGNGWLISAPISPSRAVADRSLWPIWCEANPHGCFRS
jgi:tripartite-type tricarboxylate transporter receptor subunit TctC